jgi:hypothetical protein
MTLKVSLAECTDSKRMIPWRIKPPNLPDSGNIRQKFHLVNRDGIQLQKPFVLRKILVDKQGIQVFLDLRGTQSLRVRVKLFNPDCFF